MSTTREKAYLQWKHSHKRAKLRDIARRLGVPESTVATWKRRGRWEERYDRPPGAPKGNRNAVGHGAPYGNQNALVTGAYERIALSVESDSDSVIALLRPGGMRDKLERNLAMLQSMEVFDQDSIALPILFAG